MRVFWGPLGKGVFREAPPILTPFPAVLQYGIVLDAGSSRTTVYVYQWPAEKENNTGVVSQTCKCSVKGKAQSGSGRPRGRPRESPVSLKAGRGPEKLPGLGTRK